MFNIFGDSHLSRVRNYMPRIIYNLLLNNETVSICFLVFRCSRIGGTCDCLGGVLQIGMFFIVAIHNNEVEYEAQTHNMSHLK